jgi:hypothetical protein
MTGDQQQIERIVREVLRRLAEAGEPPAHAASPPRAVSQPAAVPASPTPARPSASPAAPGNSAAAGSTPAKPARPHGQLTVNQRVITTALLAGRINGIKRVVVPPRAVITPAVRDLLRKKQIAIVWQAEPEGESSHGNDVCVAVVDPEGQFGHALSAVGAEFAGAQRWDGDCVVQAVREITRAIVQGGCLGIILTRQPSLALCQCNRRASMRAAWGVSVPAVKEALQSIGANVLVVNPALHGVPELRGILREFVNGSHTCPAPYRKALET